VSNPEIFGWGCLGGGIAYVLAFVLPELAHLATEGEFTTDFSDKRIFGWIGLILVYVLLAGFVAVWQGHEQSWRAAVAYGMSWEVVAKGIGTGSRLAVAAGKKRNGAE
jgi:protein-S-isoprenylcysteine O-methyltransferase Ste14